MSHKLASFMVFVVGVAIGSVGTWQYVKKKYELIAQEEIDSVRETFAKRATESTDEAKEKPDVTEYAARVHAYGYTHDGDASKKEKDDETPMGRPYTIAPETFGDFDGYDKIGLTYYADGILTDDNDELVEDVDDTIGFESLNAFGEYEADSVFVRNDRLKCDYEILMDERKYADVLKRKPHQYGR